MEDIFVLQETPNAANVDLKVSVNFIMIKKIDKNISEYLSFMIIIAYFVYIIHFIKNTIEFIIRPY